MVRLKVVDGALSPPSFFYLEIFFYQARRITQITRSLKFFFFDSHWDVLLVWQLKT